ncbi:MAG: DsrE family protein [Flavobacteriaceae bacterium]
MRLSIYIFIFFFTFQIQSQILPSIENFGPAFTIENPAFKTDTTQSFKAVFDVGRAFEETEKTNKLLESAARFIRLHREAGVPINQIQVALVIHGSAVFDLLNHADYQSFRESKEAFNPNYDLITALSQEGVEIILCGQTTSFRKIDKTQLHPDVKIALSAMTALVQLQNEGFRLINF